MRPTEKPNRGIERSGDSDDRPYGHPDESPGLTGFPSWRALYGFVIAVFILYIVLMRAFQGFFS